MLLRFIHVILYIRGLFFSVGMDVLFFGMDVPQFICSPVDGHFFLDEDECE